MSAASAVGIHGPMKRSPVRVGERENLNESKSTSQCTVPYLSVEYRPPEWEHCERAKRVMREGGIDG
jgi:hypothetical protein